ncbi:hypothetical protein GCM10007972_07770 [Iodidimonas muriae]|uniref:DUF2849 domain-containing protein n=1 Tax=Iodidimonas muriae TaxID=261467 RepID=A0ABQ2LC03_9PROT|nr:DUF2849 domain-containing protein [Iodidimonas muriae]GER06031.1 hypothetical protein JCM17843_03410 [Kordiimonadales bacterium JCM 17843]GGO07961.1 hypothetical protein GCM10007972_07770 [Iodidimonas muriae]
MADLKPAASQLISANALWTGQAVFLTRDGTWSTDPAQAALSTSAEDSLHLLEMAKASNARAEVELVHLAAATLREDGRPWPTRNREYIRALGPTVRRDLGYQAATARAD